MNFDVETIPNQDIWETDRKHLLHPFTHFDSFREEGSLTITSGEGATVYDADGKQYIDAVGGLWCTNIGLGRQEMADAIADQAKKLAYSNTFCDMTSAPAAQLAGLLADLAPGSLNHVFFTTGGSTAIDSAYRLIQFYQSCRGKTEKRHILSRKAAYHGSTYLSMSIGGKKSDRVPEFAYITDTIHHLSCPNYYRAPEGMSESEFCDHLLDEMKAKIHELGAENVAAFFAEPVMGAGGVVVPPAGYHRRTHELCKENDILYVSDEVVTAFGRLGEWFASESVFGIQPDIITCAKGITSGYVPLGAVLFSEEIYETIAAPNPDRVFANGFTYSGHPVSCAAALKNIEIIERENLLEKVRKDGPYLREKLEELRDLPTVGDVRGSHYMVCVESVADKQTKQPFPDAMNIGKKISNRCEEMGLIIRPVVHLNVLSPPLTLTREEIDFCIEVLRKAMIQVGEDLRAEGLLS
ncbi:MAG: aminotransferase [Lacipirellulaceae bacterium]